MACLPDEQGGFAFGTPQRLSAWRASQGLCCLRACTDTEASPRRARAQI